jgi:hypothetical protein
MMPAHEANRVAPVLSAAPVLVVVLNDPAELARARDAHWYRIPAARAPQRSAAEYLAFYQTGAFPPDERWQVRWLAPVRGYFNVLRRELLPDEPTHPHADDLYLKIVLGPLETLPRPIPSRRLRRVTFIPTTLGHLTDAQEINDLWIKTPAQERLWQALQLADLEAECQYPLDEEIDAPLADLALVCRDGIVAVIIEHTTGADSVHEPATISDYLAAARGWHVLRIPSEAAETHPGDWATRVAALCRTLGGIA